MTDHHAASHSMPGNGSYSSSMDLRNKHAELKRDALRDLQDSEKAAAAAESVRTFIRRAQASGASIGDEGDRQSAQAIIDYWTAELASSSEARESDYLPTLLAPFAAHPTLDIIPPNTPDHKEEKASESEEEKEARKIIRLSATARLWRDADNERGFLLVGRALEWAARHRDKDEDIAQLVDESERAVRHKRKMNWIYAGTGIISTCLFLGWLIGLKVPDLAKSELNVLLSTNDPQIKEKSLWDLAFYERFMPASEINKLHLTALQGLDGANLEEIELYGAGFALSEFPSVNLSKAVLPNSSFHNSKITESRFEGATLRYSQFRKANIRSTSFARASLNGAVFDEATLDDVNFAEADLRSASFKDIKLIGLSSHHFSNTAWWLAVGWSSENLAQLMELGLSQEESVLKQSKAFKDEIDNAKERILKAQAGTLERASALNYLAWILATWGIDIKGPNGTPEAVNSECEKNMDVPNNALKAASEAVCIASKLVEKATDKERAAAKRILANFQDTLGYILLQAGAKSEALHLLAEAAKVLNAEDTMFRLSVVQYASGNKGEAMQSLQTSMVEKRYVPSHELQRLRQYIQNTDFLECVYKFIDKQSPTAPQTCL
jgi:uncharacterized protein YjbI with pentapeptide repeats